MSAKEVLQEIAAKAPVIVEARQGLFEPSTIVIKFPEVVQPLTVVELKTLCDVKGMTLSDRVRDSSKRLIGCSAIGLEVYEGIILTEVVKILVDELARLGFNNVVSKYPKV